MSWLSIETYKISSLIAGSRVVVLLAGPVLREQVLQVASLARIQNWTQVVKVVKMLLEGQEHVVQGSVLAF